MGFVYMVYACKISGNIHSDILHKHNHFPLRVEKWCVVSDRGIARDIKVYF